MNNDQFEKKIRLFGGELIKEKGYISSVDILLKLGYLSKTDYENWRFGRVDYLEKVCRVNLRELSTINKIIKKVSRELNLKESWTAYMRYGRGPKESLRFSKSNNEQLEKVYATHYVQSKDK